MGMGMDMDMELLLLYAPCCLVLFLSSLYLVGLYADSRRNLPPGPRPLPVVGNLLSLRGALPHRSLARLAERHGPVMTLRLGTVTTVVASSADAARDILQRHDAAFSDRSRPDGTRAFAHYAHSMGWLPSSSPRWRALRKVCSGELFAPHRLDADRLLALRRDKARQLVSAVVRRCGSAPVALRRLAFVTALNLLSSTIFSADVADIDDHDGGSSSSSSSSFEGVLAELNATVGLPNVSDLFPELAPLDLQGLRRRIESLIQRLHAMVDEQIERRLHDRAAAAGEPEPREKEDFLDVLLDHRGGAGAEDGFDRQTLLSLVSDLFSAGTDTSAASVEWVMAELLLNPSAMAEARAELARVVGSKREVEEADVAELKYLQAVVKETFRIHPPAPLLLPHRAETATRIQGGGYVVPEGARVVVNVWAIGHDGRVWPEPEKFMPERFLVGNDDCSNAAVDFRGRDFELLPFGSGRRICPGMPLALRMVHLMLASLLHRFEWSLLPPAAATAAADDDGDGNNRRRLDMTERLGLNLSMATPLQAMATPVY